MDRLFQEIKFGIKYLQNLIVDQRVLCDTLLENVEEMKNKFDEETDRLCLLVNKLSRDLPFVERIKYRAEARGIKLPDFTIFNIPKEAAPFYGDDEYSYEIMQRLQQQNL